MRDQKRSPLSIGLPSSGSEKPRSQLDVERALRLPLEWYAALRAELSLWPERSAEILPRYHVMNEAARRALEEHWQTELAASPAARATFDKVFAHYTSAGRARFPG